MNYLLLTLIIIIFYKTRNNNNFENTIIENIKNIFSNKKKEKENLKKYISENSRNTNLKDFISKNSKKEIENEILEIYKSYNLEAFDNISKNILFIDKMIITMRTKKPRQSKQIYDNIMFISKECNNDFHSFIYSIPPDEIELNKRFKDDLRFFKSITNEKIRIARNIYIEKNKDIINSFSDLVNESDSGSTPMPYISEYQEKYNFY